MQEKIFLTNDDNKLIDIANEWINKNKEYFRFLQFTTKELIQIGKNRVDIEIKLLDKK